MSALPSPVKSLGTILSLETPNWAATVEPFELRLIHHSPPEGRKIETSVLLSPSKSNGVFWPDSFYSQIPLPCVAIFKMRWVGCNAISNTATRGRPSLNGTQLAPPSVERKTPMSVPA